MEPKEIDWDRLSALIDKHKGQKWGLIPLLQDIQEAFGYIPPESIERISEALNVFPTEVQGVITFYAGFSFVPKGKYVLKVCRGTACHVKGGRSILKMVKSELDMEEGQTSPDYQFTLETTACIGACAMAPTMMINRAYYGKLSPSKVHAVLAHHGRDKDEV